MVALITWVNLFLLLLGYGQQRSIIHSFCDHVGTHNIRVCFGPKEYLGELMGYRVTILTTHFRFNYRAIKRSFLPKLCNYSIGHMDVVDRINNKSIKLAACWGIAVESWFCLSHSLLNGKWGLLPSLPYVLSLGYSGYESRCLVDIPLLLSAPMPV